MDRDLKSTAAARRLPNAEASEADSRCQMPNYLDRESNIWRLTRLMLRVPLTASPAITAVSPGSIANHQREEGLQSYPEFANRLKRLNLAIFVNVIMGIFLYLANPPEVLYGTMIYDRILIQKDGLQKRP